MCQLPGRIKWLNRSSLIAEPSSQFFDLEKLTGIQELRGHRRRGYSRCAWLNNFTIIMALAKSKWLH